MIHEPTTFVYEPFAETDEYMTVNKVIVARWVSVMQQEGTCSVNRLLDVATGVGTMGQLFIESLPENWRQPSVICLDKDSAALAQAKERLCPLVKRLELVHSSVEEMALPERSVDVALWGNGIHYLDIPSQEEALARVAHVLKESGWLFFNSAFCAESRPPETLQFYRTQVRRAVEDLRSLGLKRDKETSRPEASSFLPKAHYEALLERVGFRLEEVKEVTVRVYRTALEHISGFHQYASGALHGYPIDAASNALRRAVAPALDEHGLRDGDDRPFVPRCWLSFIARPRACIRARA